LAILTTISKNFWLSPNFYLSLSTDFGQLQKGYKDNTFFLICQEAFEFFLPPAFMKDYRFS